MTKNVNIDSHHHRLTHTLSAQVKLWVIMFVLLLLPAVNSSIVPSKGGQRLGSFRVISQQGCLLSFRVKKAAGVILSRTVPKRKWRGNPHSTNHCSKLLQQNSLSLFFNETIHDSASDVNQTSVPNQTLSKAY